MKLESPLRYDPGLVEEAVFLAAEGHPEAKRFHRERDRIYRINHPEERERAFNDLHRGWFLQLGLADQIEEAVSEQPLLSSGVNSCLVARAPGKHEEGAELFVNPEEKLSEKERRTVSVFLRPESLLDPSALLTFLRHELMQALSAKRLGCPAAPHHAAVDRRVPKHSVALFEQAVVRRPAFTGRQLRFVAEAGIEHVGNMHEFVAEKSW